MVRRMFFSVVAGLVVGVAVIFVVVYLKKEPSIIAIGKEEATSPTQCAVYPEGYYLEAGALDRLYINHDSIHLFLGKRVQLRGCFGTITGYDGLTFPYLTVVKLAILETVVR